jgi:hypothetical protein
MKVLITGSRNWTDYARIEQVIDALPWDAEIIHGAARGADAIAGGFAAARGLKVTAYPADWKRYGNAAGPIRNDQMLALQPDLVLAFWNGYSTGTLHTINGARALGIKVRVHGTTTDN